MDIKLEDLLLITSDHIAIMHNSFIVVEVNSHFDVSEVLSKEILSKKIKEISSVANGVIKVWLESEEDEDD